MAHFKSLLDVNKADKVSPIFMAGMTVMTYFVTKCDVVDYRKFLKAVGNNLIFYR